MINRNTIEYQSLGIILSAFVIFCLSSAIPAIDARAADLPKVGTVLPPFEIISPTESAERAYLGIGEKKSFKIKDIQGDYLLLEVVGVYCPICHEQAPLFNKLYARLARTPKLAAKIKMATLATDATVEEMNMMRKKFQNPFPALNDQGYKIHKLLGEPKTPFTMIIGKKDGKVLYEHLGLISDVDAFFDQIKDIVR